MVSQPPAGKPRGPGTQVPGTGANLMEMGPAKTTKALLSQTLEEVREKLFQLAAPSQPSEDKGQTVKKSVPLAARHEFPAAKPAGKPTKEVGAQQNKRGASSVPGPSGVPRASKRETAPFAEPSGVPEAATAEEFLGMDFETLEVSESFRELGQFLVEALPPRLSAEGMRLLGACIWQVDPQGWIKLPPEEAETAAGSPADSEESVTPVGGPAPAAGQPMASEAMEGEPCTLMSATGSQESATPGGVAVPSTGPPVAAEAMEQEEVTSIAAQATMEVMALSS